jgi:predicted patatin/cPLA2 family phospholipase
MEVKKKYKFIIENLVFSGGGLRGLAFIGAYKFLQKKHLLKNLKAISGCSAGSIIGFLININIFYKDLIPFITEIDFEELQNFDYINFINNFGIEKGIKLIDKIKELLKQKNININITFKELYELTNKILTIAVVNITKGNVEYQNYMTTPNLSVILSVRMSTSIPLLFSPILYNNFYYVDGALLDPFPYFYNKNTRKIGIWLFDKCEFDFIKNSCAIFTNDLSDSFKYTLDLLRIIYINYIKKYYKKIPKNVIYINYDINLNFDKFDISITDKMKMYNMGIEKANNFFKKLKKKKRRLYLLKKYFNYWSREPRFPYHPSL